MGRVRVFAAVILIVLSGCAAPRATDQLSTDRELGHVGEFAHDDVFEFTNSDGLSKAQLEAVMHRSMARIEVIRGLKFKQDVELEVISRAEYRDRRGEFTNASPFTNELWQGTFIVGEETDVNQAFDTLYGDMVQGYYTDGRIVIIAENTDEIRIDRQTLVHELVHALQDQHFGLKRHGNTLDERRAAVGLIEGEADYITQLYDSRCGGQWQCLAQYQQPSSGSGSYNFGLFLSVYVPYAEGPSFVAHLHETDGWERVDRAHNNQPTSTAQLIHPSRYPGEPATVEITDRSNDAWKPYTNNGGEPRTEMIGEATLFASLWKNGVIDRPLTEGGTTLSPYNYSHPVTDGWAGDTFQVYHDEDGRTAHVWSLTWQTEDDAAAFADAYRTLLDSKGARSVDDGVYRIDDGPFAGAYRVTVTGETVEIVGAPSVSALESVHAAHATPSTAPESNGTSEPIAAASSGPTIASAVSASAAPADG